MKIAIITPGGVDRSGVIRVIPCLLWFIERLVKSGDEVHVFALRQEPKRGQWPLLGAKVHNAGGASPLIRGARMLNDLRSEHRHSPFDVVHALWAVPQGALAAFARRTLGVPVLLHLPGGDIARLPEIGYGARTTLTGRLALRLAVASADRIVAPSDAMAQQSRALGIHAERIPFGVALDHWPVLAPRRRVDGASMRLLHVADISPVKDQAMLLTAMHFLLVQGMDFLLDIIGEDTLHGAIARRAHQLGLQGHVRFHGFLPQSALRERMREAHLLIVSSRHEAGPIVALEAAASGVPTIGTKVGLLADWAPRAARVVNIGDGLALGAVAAELWSNEDLRLQLASEAQNRAVAENADITTRRIQSLYMAIADAKLRSGNRAARTAAR
ncbi:MAG TPA: glycosyltransferase family 4 protein [Rhizomicrobium sp.]|jgi:glycosyltransferase involved in cell wall biosynthesis|nr:glycosyltransferase family 4 protein [Rhizomicrobium sp.]